MFSDGTEKLVLKFTAEITVDARPTEGTLTAMSEIYTGRLITSLVFAICG